MDKTNNLENKIFMKMSEYFHYNGMNDNGESLKIIYELCYLRLLSLIAFKDIESREVTLIEFIDKYKSILDKIVRQNLLDNISNELEVSFYNHSLCLELANDVLNDLKQSRYLKHDISPLIHILCSYNGIGIKNIFARDLTTFDKYSEQTPSSVCNIANYVLDINKNDRILDIGSAYGNYLVSVTNSCEYGFLEGIELDNNRALISKIRLCALGTDFNIINDDMFKVQLDKKYDKILCNYPLGMRYQRIDIEEYLNSQKWDKYKWDKISNNSIDWMFIHYMLERLNDNGKCIAIVHGGPLFKVSDEQYRRDIINNGLLESVIKLPNVFNYTNIEQYMLVFSKNNKNVSFYDLADQVEKERGKITFVDMQEIINILNNNNSKYYVEVDAETILNNECSLVVSNYIGKREIKYYNPERLSKYLIDIFRGYQMPSSEQKELESVDGNYELLMISDIENGQISDNLLKIKANEKKYDRYLLKENDLIISSKSTKIKIADVENIGDRKIIANGSLLVLRVDTEQINPHYLEMYLNSIDGQTILNRIQTGAVIISINPSRLKEIDISTLPIEKQNEIAKRYKSKKVQILLAKEHLKKLEEEQINFFDKEVVKEFGNE